MSKGPAMEVHAYADSDVGLVRSGNEDKAFAGTTAFAVADGMGGHVAGEVASETALEPVRELDGTIFRTDKAARQALVEAIAAANRAVVEMADADPQYRGMGTTLTAAVLRDGKLHVAHVGDSRAYLLRDDGQLLQLTTDHTLVQQLIREGRLSPDEAAVHPQRSVITRAIGIEDEVDIDALPPLALEPGDQVLLCSDGLTGPVGDDTIAKVLRSIPDGNAACQALIDAANAAGGPDNITVVLLRVDDHGTGRGAAGAAAAADTPASDETQELSRPLGAPAGDDGIRQIRTREESGRDWASSMSRYGAPQGATRGTGGSPGGRAGRIVAVVLAVVIILALVVGGGVFLLSRAWYVGEDDGAVAIYRGVPSEVAGARLARVVDTTDIPLDDLPPRRAERIRQGITFGSYAEASRYVTDLRAALDESEEEDDEAPTDAADDAGASP